jgi:hypothetical protein
MLQVWDLDTAEEVETIQGHERAVLCCAYDPTGMWIVSGSLDRTIRLYKAGSDNPAIVVGRHEQAVCAVCFSNSGQYVFSAGRDDVAAMWDWSVAYQVRLCAFVLTGCACMSLCEPNMLVYVFVCGRYDVSMRLQVPGTLACIYVHRVLPYVPHTHTHTHTHKLRGASILMCLFLRRLPQTTRPTTTPPSYISNSRFAVHTSCPCLPTEFAYCAYSPVSAQA